MSVSRQRSPSAALAYGAAAALRLSSRALGRLRTRKFSHEPDSPSSRVPVVCLVNCSSVRWARGRRGRGWWWWGGGARWAQGAKRLAHAAAKFFPADSATHARAPARGVRAALRGVRRRAGEQSDLAGRMRPERSNDQL